MKKSRYSQHLEDGELLNSQVLSSKKSYYIPFRDINLSNSTNKNHQLVESNIFYNHRAVLGFRTSKLCRSTKLDLWSKNIKSMQKKNNVKNG